MTLLMVAILWFLLSFVIANAASQRGRGPFAWFIFSIVTSPILAALLLLLFPPVANFSTDVLGSDQTIRTSIQYDDERRSKSAVPAIVILIGSVTILLAVLGYLLVEMQKNSHPAADTSTSSLGLPSNSLVAYGTVQTYLCSQFLNAFDTPTFQELSGPIISYVRTFEPTFGTNTNIVNFTLTECRLNENELIGKAVSNLFEQKRVNRLPRIPIGGATNDIVVENNWSDFKRWIHHQGPRPDFGLIEGH